MPYRIYESPGGEALSDQTKVWLNGREMPVHEARVSAMPFNRRWPGHQRSMDQSEIATFVSFEMDEPVEISVKPNRKFENVIIRPLSKGVKPKIDGDTICFTISEPSGYTLEIDGYHNALHLFADPIKAYDVDINRENTLYFGPGVHDVGMIHLQSNQTVFVDYGAIVYTCIDAENAENIKILGRGMLDNSRNKEKILFDLEKSGDGNVDVGNSLRLNTIRFTNCRNIVVDGITIRDSLVYNVTTFGCEDVVVDNVKIIGCWRYNSDGIDLHNSTRCVIKNCFVRTYDDAICIKAHDNFPQICGDTLVENCVVWCDWGRCLEIGAETRAEEIRNITFHGCDLIRSTDIAMDVQNVDYADVHDIIFDDIRAEFDDCCQRPQMQKDDEAKFVVDPNSKYMPSLITSIIYKHHEYSSSADRRGINRHIQFKNIKVYSNRMPPSKLAGYDEKHQSSDIHIDGLYLNGKKISSLDEANLKIGPFASDITLVRR